MWYFKDNIIYKISTLSVVFVCAFLFTQSVYAADTYKPAENFVIGEFIYNDDYTPTTDDCTISIYSPAGATLVNEATMTDDATGWHSYSYTAPAPEGKYPTFITCGTLIGGDLLKLDKSFLVKSPEVTDASIASSVWSSGTRSLTTFGTLVSDIWSNGSRSLTTFGTLVSDIWNNGTRSLTTKNIAGGGSFATESYIDASEATVIAEVQVAEGLINNLNNISADDVWVYGSRSLNTNVQIDDQSVTDIWDRATASMNTAGSIGRLVAGNLDAQVSSRGTSNLTAGDVWANATRTLSTTGVDAVSAGVWASAGRTLTNYGNDITAADVWNTLSSTLTTVGSIGKQLSTNVDGTISGVVAEVQETQALINDLNNISAADVWSYGTRSTNSGTVTIDTASKQGVWDVATSGLTTPGTIGKKIVDNLDAQVSSRGTSNLTAGDVWANATRTLTDYSSSALATAVWANATRTLTSYGNDITAEDVWNVLSSTLTTVGSIGEQVATNLDAPVSTVTEGWSVKMGNVERVQSGYTYRTKVFILDATATPTAPLSAPTMTLYDPSRNVVVSGVPTNLISTGVYEYTYSVANNAEQGLWEAVASTQVEAGKIVQTNDYFEVTGSPAQVLINSVTAPAINNIIGNVTVTNEGLSGYEYTYEWCVVTSLSNECGGNDDAYYASAAKFINPGEDWNTNLSATVATAGTYYFKLVVYFGTDSSSASRVFTITPGAGGGNGGGGGSSGGTTTVPVGGSCNGADFNKDASVNSIDFSILLYFWKTLFPFANPCVDVNVDKKVDSVDFSIMLYQWGSNPL